MAEIARGRLAAPATGPAHGEHPVELLRTGSVVVEHILSGTLDAPVDYLQDVDELAVVLTGDAVLDVAGTTHDLTAGDWVVIPAGTPHRLVRTTPGTAWLAVHARA